MNASFGPDKQGKIQRAGDMLITWVPNYFYNNEQSYFIVCLKKFTEISTLLKSKFKSSPKSRPLSLCTKIFHIENTDTLLEKWFCNNKGSSQYHEMPF